MQSKFINILLFHGEQAEILSGSAFPVCVMLCKERGAKAARSDRPFQPDPASRQTLQSGVFRPRLPGKKSLATPLFPKRRASEAPSKRRRKPPRSPPKEGGGTLLVPSGRRASEAALFFSKGGPRNSPHFTSLPASFLPSRKGLSPRLPLPLVQKKRPGSSLSPPVKISSGLREGRAARKIPGLSSGFRLRVFRPACGGSGLYRRNVRTRSVKFSVRPAGGFRHIRLAGRTGA